MGEVKLPDVAPEEFTGELSPEQVSAIEDMGNGMFGDNPKPEEKKKEEESPSGEEEKKPDETPEPKEGEEEKPGDKAPEKTEAEKKAEEAAAEEERLKKFAEEEGLTLDEAKESLAKDKALVERHANDPLKLARALRKENSAYGKLKNENDKLKSFKAEVEASNSKITEDRFNADMDANRDKIVAKYLEIKPAEADQSEDVIFERAKVLIKENLKRRDAQLQKETTEKAEEKREELVSKIPEEYKEFVPEIKEVLKDTPDAHVLSTDFDIMNVAYWARGKKYNAAYVKSLEEAAYKRGKEEPAIKEKKAATISSGSRSTSGGKAPVAATAEDKRRALEIYGSREDMTEEQMIQAYLENNKGKDF